MPNWKQTSLSKSFYIDSFSHPFYWFYDSLFWNKASVALLAGVMCRHTVVCSPLACSLKPREPCQFFHKYMDTDSWANNRVLKIRIWELAQSFFPKLQRTLISTFYLAIYHSTAYVYLKIVLFFIACFKKNEPKLFYIIGKCLENVQLFKPSFL